MKKLFLTVAVCCFTFTTMAQNTPNLEKDYIEVYGYAERKVLPDIAFISITLDEQDPATSSKGIKVQEKAMKQKLQALGIDIEKQLSLDNITSQFAKRKNIDQKSKYTLELTDLSILQEVFSALEEEGISNIYIKRYKLSNIDAIKLELKTAAVKDAKIKALAIAAGADIKVHNLMQAIDNDRGGYSNDYPVMASSYKSNDSDVDEDLPNLKVTKIKISSSINTRWRCY